MQQGQKQKKSEVLLLLSLNHQQFLCLSALVQMFTLADILVPLLATVDVVGTV